jgi:hypothetical protein
MNPKKSESLGERSMAEISLFYLNTIDFTLAPLHAFGLSGDPISINSQLSMSGVEYVLLFANVDGVVSQGPATVPSSAGFATGYYGLKGNSWVTPGLGGIAGGGPTPVSDSYVQVVGFDATANTLALVTFTLQQQGGGGLGRLLNPLQPLEGGGAFGGIALPTPLASGCAIQTTTNGATVTAPETDGVTQSSNYEAAVFSYWYNVSTGEKTFAGLASNMLAREEAFLGLISNGPLTLDAGTGGLFLAVYSAALKSPPPIRLH